MHATPHPFHAFMSRFFRTGITHIVYPSDPFLMNIGYILFRSLVIIPTSDFFDRRVHGSSLKTKIKYLHVVPKPRCLVPSSFSMWRLRFSSG
jgi:hypothetical protein